MFVFQWLFRMPYGNDQGNLSTKPQNFVEHLKPKHSESDGRQKQHNRKDQK